MIRVPDLWILLARQVGAFSNRYPALPYGAQADRRFCLQAPAATRYLGSLIAADRMPLSASRISSFHPVNPQSRLRSLGGLGRHVSFSVYPYNQDTM